MRQFIGIIMAMGMDGIPVIFPIIGPVIGMDIAALMVCSPGAGCRTVI